jgi:hypothetical protein
MFKNVTVSLLSVFLIATVLGSCDSASEKEPAQTEDSEVDMTGPEYTSAYVCPMHCEGSGSDQPGNCPVCGMDYVPRAELEIDQPQ